MSHLRSITSRARDARRHRHRQQSQHQPLDIEPNSASIAVGTTWSSAAPVSPIQSPHQTSVARGPRTPLNGSSNNQRPPLVSPSLQPWEEELQHGNQQYHSGNYHQSSDRSVASERPTYSSSPMYRKNPNATTTTSSPTKEYYSSNRSVVSDTYLLSESNVDEEIPMDERSADMQSFNGVTQSLNNGMGGTSRMTGHHVHNVPPSPARPTSVELHHKVSTAPRMPGSGPAVNNLNSNIHNNNSHNPQSQDDDVSSLGGVEESNVVAMTTALRSHKTVLHGLSPDERTLWDTMQRMLQQEKKRDTRREDLEQVAALEEQLSAQQKEHEQALRAFQRVLADVTDERDKAVATTVSARERDSLKEEKKESGDDDNGLLTEKDVADLRDAKKRAESELDTLKKQNAKLKRQLTSHRSSSNKENSPNPEKSLEKSGSGDSGDSIGKGTSDEEGLKKQLADAKLIIASLENASGSLANDTRLKLKSKETEIADLQSDVQQYKRKLDTLATELREAQRVSAEADEYRNEIQQQFAELKSTLESTLAEIRSASCILETTHDPSSIQNLSEIFAECSESFRLTLDLFERNNGEDSEADSNDGDTMRRPTSNSASSNSALREELQKFKDEALRYKLEAERIEKVREKDVKTLYAEIQLLRVECTTNMDVLAKKERELAVLRDSLKVDEDAEVGYISDDATEGDSEEEGNDNLQSAPPPPPPPPPLTGEYGPSQAEALATLLAHGGNSSAAARRNVSGGAAMLSNAETNNLRGELAQSRMEKDRAVKELKTERESLANAKMIISSLEKANKSMMEDLRSRLHDSNTAIASLLEKSMESEKTTAKLQAELEVLRTEKAKNEDAIMSQQGVSASMATETID